MTRIQRVACAPLEDVTAASRFLSRVNGSIAYPVAERGRRAMKRLIACCDGTWNDADAPAETTNVIRMARAIKTQTAEGIEQIVYYHSGVGTGGDEVNTVLGGAVGLGLGRNVRDTYAFLADNFCNDDEIFLFGFSRGAYTARSVAGLIGWAGLLHRRDMDDFDLLWDAFRRRRDADARDQHFADRRTDIEIKCIGVWDTVGALGIPGHMNALFKEYYDFYDTNLGAHVAHAYQALALDERREDFKPTLWQRPAPQKNKQELLQVWFAGVHSDVGGGYAEHGASDVSLAWMAARVADKLELDLDYLRSRQDRRQGWGFGILHDSAQGFWQALPRIDRHPAPGNDLTCEYLHESVGVRSARPAGAAPAGYVTRAIGLPAPSGCYAPLTAFEAQLRWAAPDATATGESARPPPSLIGRVLKSLGGG